MYYDMVSEARYSKISYIIIRRNAKGNENGPRKKKFVISLQTCTMYKVTYINNRAYTENEPLNFHLQYKMSRMNLISCVTNLLQIGQIGN
jgi:hypothetical protein